MSRRGRSSRGFTIIELLFAVMLLTTFMFAAGKLFHANFMLSYKTSQQRNAVAEIETAIGILREATRTATAMTAPDARSVVLISSSGRVTWSCHDDALIQLKGAAETRWRMPAGTTIKIEGPAVVLHVPGGGVESGDIRLQSQAKVLERLLP